MYRKIQESELIEITPLMFTTAVQGQYPVFLHPESPYSAQLGTAAMVDVLLAATPLFTDVASDSLCPHVHLYAE